MNTAAFVLSLLMLATPTTGPPDWALKDHAYRTFLRDLQTGVRSDDRRAVSRLVDLPLRVNRVGGRVRYYRDRRSVEKAYNLIFTPKVRRAIIGQRFNQLFVRDQGLMIGDGQVWFDHTCLNAACNLRGPVRIKAVNQW